MRERGVTHLLWPQGGVLWSVERVHTNMQTQQSGVASDRPRGGEVTLVYVSVCHLQAALRGPEYAFHF